jgi:MFS family permease
MSDAGATHTRGIDYRLLLPLMAHALFTQTLIGVIRVTTSYRVLDLGLSVVWLGAISATFSLMPVFIAMWVGRFIDRGNDALACRIGSALVLAAGAGLAFASPNAGWILAYTVVLGIGHLFLMASQQMLCVRSAGERHRETVFGNFLVAGGIGQGLGPFIVGWVGGDARIPDTNLLFTIGVALCVVAMGVSLLLPVASRAGKDHAARPAKPLAELIRIPGFAVILIASIVTITAQDLVVVYLPLLGTERGIDSGHVGLALTVRSAAAIVSRLFYVALINAFGRHPLTIASMTIAGVAFALLAAPLPLFGIYADAALMGLGVGIATTLSLTSVVDAVPVQARATALSLRITGNRIGQVTLPFIASSIAAATGAPGVLFVIGASLCASAASIEISRLRRR